MINPSPVKPSTMGPPSTTSAHSSTSTTIVISSTLSTSLPATLVFVFYITQRPSPTNHFSPYHHVQAFVDCGATTSIPVFLSQSIDVNSADSVHVIIADNNVPSLGLTSSTFTLPSNSRLGTSSNSQRFGLLWHQATYLGRFRRIPER